MGALRPPRATPLLPLWWHGKPALDLLDAHRHRGRPLLGRLDCPRIGAFLVWQLGNKRHMERLLDQRRLHRVL